MPHELVGAQIFFYFSTHSIICGCVCAATIAETMAAAIAAIIIPIQGQSYWLPIRGCEKNLITS